MNPRLVAPAAGLFGLGWWVGVLVHRRRCEEIQMRLYRALLVADANRREVAS